MKNPRIKERNARRLEESVRKGKLKVIFNSNPIEFTPDAVMLEVKGSVQKLPNDYVWIFAGGEPSTAFLKKIGIAFGPTDLTSEGGKLVRELEFVQA
jgi:thioredoxin reductase